MILGVYWYFKFPDNLYQFKYFQFFQGYGGHTDNLAELQARVEVQHPENILLKFEKLVSQYPSAFLYVGINENQILISINDYYLFDFYFQLAAEIENILTAENAISSDVKEPFVKQTEKIFRNNWDGKFTTIQHKFIQIVGSEFKKNNAENLSIRIDCNIPLSHKNDFIKEVKTICSEEKLNIFYYHIAKFNNHCNLMLFFTNGRQKKDNTQFVNINSFGSKLFELSQKHPLYFGHFKGLEYYPTHNLTIELMKDEEYIIKQEIKKS